MTIKFTSCISTWFCCTALLFISASEGRAQVTVESLLANSVEQVGPQHREVGDAIEQFKKGQLLEARNLLESAKSKDPQLPPAGVLLAQLLYAANQPALARAELERVVRDVPKDPESYLLFGEIAFQQRRFADAELAFTKAGELTQQGSMSTKRKNSMVLRSLSGLAGVAEVREQWPLAERYLKQIARAKTDDVNNTNRLARSLFRQDENLDGKGKETEAYDLLKALWSKDNSVRRPEITMGAMYQEAGNKAMAAKLMKLASTRDTQGAETQLAVARWALESGDLELAKTCSDRAVSVAKGSIEAKLVAGLVARYQNDFDRARRALESAHLQSPSNLAAILQLAVVMIENDSPAAQRAALEYSRIARLIYPDLSDAAGREAAVTSAYVLFRQSRVAEAQRLLQQALTGGTVSAESSYYAARVLNQANRDFAKKLLQSALKNDRQFPNRVEAEKLLTSLGG